jgi:gas vesicle protein
VYFVNIENHLLKSKNDMKDQTKVIAALLVGAAAGAAIGLLLAPESGSELREDIADYVNDLFEKAKNQAQNTVGDVKDYTSSVVDKAKSKFNGVVGDANDYKDEAVDAAQSKADEAKDKVKSTANDWNNSIQQA